MDHGLHLPSTSKPRVVVIGGGFGGLNFISRLDTRYYQVVLFDQHNYHTFIPLLYQVATAGLEAPSVVGPLRKVFQRKADFHFRMLRVEHIDPVARKVYTAGGSTHYDHLVIATGTKANFFGNQEIAAHALPLKTLPDARRMRNHVFQVFERLELTNDPLERQRLLTFIVVGGGPTGVEMAGALAELRDHVLPKDYPDQNIKQMKILLLEGGDRLLAAFSAKSSRDAARDLRAMGVDIQLNTLVADFDGRQARLKDGTEIPARTMVWGAGVIGETVEGLPLAAVTKGQYVVDEYLKVEGLAQLYALGDVARLITPEWPQGHPGVAQVAMQMGQRLAKNLNALAQDKERVAFHYFDKGSLATIGRKKAVADLPGGLHFRGTLAWYVWAVVHLFYLIGFRNRLVTLLSWIGNYFTYSRSIRLVMEPTLAEELVAGD